MHQLMLIRWKLSLRPLECLVNALPTQLYAVRLVEVCDISELILVPSINVIVNVIMIFITLCSQVKMFVMLHQALK